MIEGLTLAELVKLRDEVLVEIVEVTAGRRQYEAAAWHVSAAPKPFAIRSEALTKSAKGQECTLRLPGVCNHDPSTVVLCHLPGSKRTGSKGTGQKGHDTHAVYGCRACHDYIDGRQRRGDILRVGRYDAAPLADAIILDAMLRALDETHYRMVEAGLITVKGFQP